LKKKMGSNVPCRSQKLTLELKGRLLDMEEKTRTLEATYKGTISGFLEAIGPFVERLREENNEDPLRDEFLKQVRILADAGTGGSVVVSSENPIQRQARLESLTGAMREQRSLVEFLATTGTSSGAPNMRGDLQSLPFIVSHFVLERLDAKSAAALACACKYWQKRAKAYKETRVRTNLLCDFVDRERKYAADLNLAIATFARAMEKHGLVDKTVIFLNIPVLEKASRLLVSELRDRVLHFSAMQLVGDVFVRLAPAFDLLLFYASGLESSLKLIKSLQARPEANAIISEIAVRLGRDATSFLLLPVKRGMEVRDFLNAMLEACPKEHADVPHLQRAAEQMRAVVEELDKRNKVDSVLDHIQGLPSRVKEIGSSVLREGAAVFAEGAGRLFLCSGCIVVAVEDNSGALVFHNLIEFKPTPPVVLSSAEHLFAFDLQTSRGSTAVAVKSVEERISWMQSVKTAIDAFLRKSSALNVFATRKEPISSPLRSTSMTVSRRTGAMFGKATQVPTTTTSPLSVSSSALKEQRKMLTLGGRSKAGAKNLRGLQKRPPVVDLASGTHLYEVTTTGRVIHLDVHPASLSSDGAFVLMTPTRIFCFCGPKLSPDSKLFALSLKLARDLSGPGVHVQVADQNDENFWASFGARFKLSEPTPKEVVDRYNGRFVLHVIHSNMQITEEDAATALKHLRDEPCHFVFDAKDDVYVFCGAEAPVINKSLAMAKGDEVFDSDAALRPACASVIEVHGSKKSPVFDLIVRFLTEGATVQKVTESAFPRPLSFNLEEFAQLKRSDGGKLSPGKMSPAKASQPPSLSGASLPARDWSAFDCTRDVDPQLERVDMRRSPRQAASVAAQTMAAANAAATYPAVARAQGSADGKPGVSSASPRTSIRQHKQKLDNIFDMLDKARPSDPTATDISYSSEDSDVDVDSGESVETELYIAKPQTRDRNDSTAGLQDALDQVYAEFSEDDVAVANQILNV
jgi:hypothetical protein